MARQPRNKNGAAPAPRRTATPRVHRALVWLLVVVAVACGLYLLRRPILSRAGHALVASDPLEKADAAVVLGGEDSRHAERVMAAVKLYREGFVRKLVLSGPEWAYGVHETDFSVPAAVAAGVPRGDIVAVPSTTHSTEEEAANVIPLLLRSGFHSIYVTTSNYHTGRARRIFRKLAGGRLRVLAYPARNDWFDPDHWWESREGRKIFVLEAAKTLNSLLE
jgi:uncharacterized SAM-binding protein YcdF (DUF218 family)